MTAPTLSSPGPIVCALAKVVASATAAMREVGAPTPFGVALLTDEATRDALVAELASSGVDTRHGRCIVRLEVLGVDVMVEAGHRSGK